MRDIVAAISLFAVACVVAPAHADLIADGSGQELAKEAARLTEELRRAQLGQIAILTDYLSEGKSRLLIGRVARGQVPAGTFVPPRAGDDGTLVEAYPLSSPLSAELADVGKCELLGAVSLLLETVAADTDDAYRDDAARPDVYLVAYHVTDGLVEEVVLVSLSVDDEGQAKLEPVLHTLARRTPNIYSLPPPAAVVTLPKLGEGAEHAPPWPPWRATVTMLGRKHMWRFALDPVVLRGH